MITSLFEYYIDRFTFSVALGFCFEFDRTHSICRTSQLPQRVSRHEINNFIRNLSYLATYKHFNTCSYFSNPYTFKRKFAYFIGPTGIFLNQFQSFTPFSCNLLSICGFISFSVSIISFYLKRDFDESYNHKQLLTN